jgi:hypothetical protein
MVSAEFCVSGAEFVEGAGVLEGQCRNLEGEWLFKRRLLFL